MPDPTERKRKGRMKEAQPLLTSSTPRKSSWSSSKKSPQIVTDTFRNPRGLGVCTGIPFARSKWWSSRELPPLSPGTTGVRSRAWNIEPLSSSRRNIPSKEDANSACLAVPPFQVAFREALSGSNSSIITIIVSSKAGSHIVKNTLDVVGIELSHPLTTLR